jgi:hypothetical protein
MHTPTGSQVCQNWGQNLKTQDESGNDLMVWVMIDKATKNHLIYAKASHVMEYFVSIL